MTGDKQHPYEKIILVIDDDRALLRLLEYNLQVGETPNSI